MRTNYRLTTFALVLAATGCGEKVERLPTVPVEGKVLYKGKPAAGAQVVLLPAGDGSPDAIKPTATVGADGTYRLTTYPSREGTPDGAPVGEYLVSIRWTTRPEKPKAEDDDDLPPGPPGGIQPDRLKEKYSNPKTSGLKVKIDAAGKLDPPVLDLK